MTMWFRPKSKEYTVGTRDNSYKEIRSKFYLWDYGSWGRCPYRVCRGGGGGGGSATWRFEEIPPGRYDVLVWFVSHENRSTHVVYDIVDNDIPLGSTHISQKNANGKECWKSLGVYDLLFGTITVTMHTSEDGYVVAGFVRLKEKFNR